jgi:competence protein ComGC
MIFKYAKLIIIVLVLAVTTIVVPKLAVNAATESIHDSMCRGNIALIEKQIKLSIATQGKITPLTELFADGFYFPDGIPVCPFGIPYVLDANNHVIPHNHKISHFQR